MGPGKEYLREVPLNLFKRSSVYDIMVDIFCIDTEGRRALMSLADYVERYRGILTARSLVEAVARAVRTALRHADGCVDPMGTISAEVISILERAGIDLAHVRLVEPELADDAVIEVLRRVFSGSEPPFEIKTL